MKRAWTTVLGLAQACHPFPTAAVVALTALVGIASTQGHADASRLLRCVAGMLCAQLLIGWTNDYMDRRRDELHQPSKPLAAGLVDARLLPPLISLAGLASVNIALSLNFDAALLVSIGILAGLAYDLGIKDTRWSWAPFVVAFAVLPPYVWASLGAWRSEFVYLYLVALPLVVAAHIANALPDIDTDAASGRRSLTVRLGHAGSLRALSACLLATPLLTVLSLPWLSYDGWVLAATLIVYGKLLALATYAYRVSGGRGGAVWGFRFVALAGVLFAAGWLASVG